MFFLWTEWGYPGSCLHWQINISIVFTPCLVFSLFCMCHTWAWDKSARSQVLEQSTLVKYDVSMPFVIFLSDLFVFVKSCCCQSVRNRRLTSLDHMQKYAGTNYLNRFCDKSQQKGCKSILMTNCQFLQIPHIFRMTNKIASLRTAFSSSCGVLQPSTATKRLFWNILIEIFSKILNDNNNHQQH